MIGIKLYMFDFELGYLSFSEQGYTFCANQENILAIYNSYPIQSRMFKLNNEGVATYKKLPYPFNEFLIYTNRDDIKEKASIDNDDLDFVKLYKLASLDMELPVFNIKQL